MQTIHRPFQPGKLGLPSSPACTRPRRDVSFVEGHLRAESQPIVFAPVRPLCPHRSMASDPVSVSIGAANITPTFTSHSERPVGPKALGTRQSSTSVISESSTSSISFQERMKGSLSQRSSFTSVEDEPEESKLDPPQIESPLFFCPREDLQDRSRYLLVLGDGESIWNRVSAAASTLKVNVNKAWTSTINTSEEQETSPESDSHLVRVMKAYHLAKASHPSDLPDWLFDECERKPSLSSRFAESRRGAGFDIQPPPNSFCRTHNEVAPRAPQHSRTALDTLLSSGKTGPSKATDRLKAFREATRADLGVRHAYSKSEGLTYSPSRIHTSMDAHHGANHRDSPLQLAQQLRPGAF